MNLKKAISYAKWQLWFIPYNLLGLKWWSCDYLGIQCKTCKRSALCDIMLQIGLRWVFWS